MLASWKKSYDQPRRHIKKQRHYFANKCPSSQGCGFSSSHVRMWELDYKESWAPKNRCFWTVVLENTLWSPLDSKRSSQSILKEISPEYSLERLMLKLKLQYLATWCKELTHWKRPWCWERLKAGGDEDDRGWDGWMASPTQWTWVWTSSGKWWWTGKPGRLQSMGLQRVRQAWASEKQHHHIRKPWDNEERMAITCSQQFQLLECLDSFAFLTQMWRTVILLSLHISLHIPFWENGCSYRVFLFLFQAFHLNSCP